MEKVIKFLITLSTITAVMLVLVVVAVMIYYLRSRSMADNLLNKGIRDNDFIYKLLRTSFSKGRIIQRAVLPEFRPDGSVARTQSDIILIDRGGIFIIKIKNASGAVDNSLGSVWTIKNKNGIAQFPNPFEQNLQSLRAVKEILKRENIYNIPLYNMVVFSGRRVSFRARSEKLFTADVIIDALKDFNRNKFLSQKEINDSISAIRKYLPQSRKR